MASRPVLSRLGRAGDGDPGVWPACRRAAEFVMAPLPPPHPDPHPPTRFVPPPGACDAHCHIFGPQTRFPYQSPRSYQPAETPLEAYHQLQALLGLSRAVFVQPAVYGLDHAAIIDAISRGCGRYRGVGIVGERSDVDALAAAGIRAARFNFVGHLGGADIGEVRETAARVSSLGWHIVLHVDGAALAQHADAFAGLACDFVIDHMARLTAGDGVRQSGFAGLLALARHPHCWVKISAGDRMVPDAARLSEAVPFMRAIAEAAPNRTLWGTDWPHPNVRFIPNDGDMLDLLAEAVPDQSARDAILVANPARLYGFEQETMH